MEYTTEGEEGFVFDIGSVYHSFEKLTDQRKAKGVRYRLPVALTLILLAKLAGEDGPAGIATWLKYRAGMLVKALKLGRTSMPHRTTISRILGKAVAVEDFETIMGELFQGRVADTQELVIALDGKTLRGTIEIGESQGLHLLAAYLPSEGLVLMQVAVACKENEIVAAPKLLQCLDLRNKVVIADALHTQRKLSAQIVAAQGDYIWTVKDNHPQLRQDIEDIFGPEPCKAGFSPAVTDFDSATTTDKDHGRLETRTITVTDLLNDYLDWPGVQQVFRLQRRFIKLNTGEVSSETSFGITSLSSQRADPDRLLSLIRSYWGIENGLHYRRDVTLNEDRCRLKIGHAARMMAALNNLTLSILLSHGVTNVSQQRKRYCALPLEALRLITCA